MWPVDVLHCGTKCPVVSLTVKQLEGGSRDIPPGGASRQCEKTKVEGGWSVRGSRRRPPMISAL